MGAGTRAGAGRLGRAAPHSAELAGRSRANRLDAGQSGQHQGARTAWWRGHRPQPGRSRQEREASSISWWIGKVCPWRRCCPAAWIAPRTARRGVDSSQRLGRYRWIVEPTNAWVLAYRRLALRFDRGATSALAFLHLACALIGLRFLHHSAGDKLPRSHPTHSGTLRGRSSGRPVESARAIAVRASSRNACGPHCHRRPVFTRGGRELPRAHQRGQPRPQRGRSGPPRGRPGRGRTCRS
jgi:hypothetical protein